MSQAKNTVATRAIRRNITGARQAQTLELATALCPHEALAANLSRTFGIDPVDFHLIREKTEEHVVAAANELTDDLNEKAMAIHLQRIVSAYVSSACGAGKFYSDRVTAARQLTAAGANDDRDDDRGGAAGFDDRASRARQFAAEAGLQAHALLAAATGAVHAYAHITGEDWKAYQPDNNTQPVNRQAASTEIEAFNA